MARQRLRPTRRPFRFLSCIVLLECCCTVVCELQRTSGSTCGNIACPGEVVQYECAVPSTGTGVVWKLPECLDQDIPIIRQGNTANTVNKMCVDGTTVVMAQGNVSGSSFVSYLVINITGPLESFTVECTFDDGTNTRSIGTDGLTSTTAPAPVNLRHLSTSDSEIVVVWDEDSQLEECSNLWYNFTHSDICGTCIPARDENMITCTNFEMGECNLMVQSLVCGDNVVNESMLIIDTSRPTTSVSDSTATNSDNSALHPGIIAGITIIVSVAIIAAVVAGILLIVIYYCNKRKSQRLNTPVDEKHPLNKTGTSEGLGDISTNNGTDQGDTQLSESTEVGICASGPSGIQEVGYNDGLDGGTDEQGSATGTTNVSLEDRNIEPNVGEGDAGGAGSTGESNGPGSNKVLPLSAEESSLSVTSSGLLDSKEKHKRQVVPLQGGNALQGSNGHHSSVQPTISAITETLEAPSSPSPFVGSETTHPGVIPPPSTTRSAETFFYPPPEDRTPAQQETERPNGAKGGNSQLTEASILEIMSRFESRFGSKLESIESMIQKKVVTQSDKERIAVLEKKLDEEIKTREAEVSNLKEENEQLKSQIAKFERTLRDKETQHKKELSDEKEKHRKELEDVQNAAFKDKEAAVTALQQTIEELKIENKTLKTTLIMQQHGDN